MKKITVTVTEQDSGQTIPTEANIALEFSVRRALGYSVRIAQTFIWFYDRERPQILVRLPQPAREFLWRRYVGERVRPFVFEIELPEGLCPESGTNSSSSTKAPMVASPAVTSISSKTAAYSSVLKTM